MGKPDALQHTSRQVCACETSSAGLYAGLSSCCAPSGSFNPSSSGREESRRLRQARKALGKGWEGGGGKTIHFFLQPDELA